MKAIFTSVSLLVLSSAIAFGLAGKIGAPEIGHRTDISDVQKKQVGVVLSYMQKELKFIDGSFINEFSHQRFGGTSSQVSRFIKLLGDAGIWEVQVRFRDFGEQDSGFTLHQDSSESLNLEVNSGRDDFLLKDFRKYLPQPGLGLATPTAIRTKAEQVDAVQPATAVGSNAEGKAKTNPESEGRSQ